MVDISELLGKIIVKIDGLKELAQKAIASIQSKVTTNV